MPGFIILFLASCILLYASGELVVRNLVKVARFLGVREFVVALVVIAFAGSLPNLFVGFSSILHNIPELSLAEIMGGNVIDTTLAIALAVLFSTKTVVAQSKTVQTISLFSAVSAVLPVLLILDGKLSRADGLVLLIAFFFYMWWLFSKKERFSLVYNTEPPTPESVIKDFKNFLANSATGVLGIILLLIAAEGIVRSALGFAEYFKLSIPLLGVLVVGLGNSLPETYFAIASARKGETWIILGNLMGSIIIPGTFVLGLVAVLSPITITNLSALAITRIFLVISASFFYFFVRTDTKITKREAIWLLGLYTLFAAAQIIFNLK